MRIIGGKWRSRRIEFPSDPGTRPMPDRMREAVFDILVSRFGCPGGLPPIDVVDLFAGSGSLGLEAISRGAAACDFVERRKPALAVLRRNLVQLESGATCRIVAGNAGCGGGALTRVAQRNSCGRLIGPSMRLLSHPTERGSCTGSGRGPIVTCMGSDLG